MSYIPPQLEIYIERGKITDDSSAQYSTVLVGPRDFSFPTARKLYDEWRKSIPGEAMCFPEWLISTLGFSRQTCTLIDPL